MTIKPTKFQQQVIINMNGLAIFNDETGTIRYHNAGNDVFQAIESLGGISKAANKLNVSINTINEWIDDYFVPDVYAMQINRLTEYSAWSIQQPPHWTLVEGSYWPQSGFTTEKNMRAIYMTCELSQK